MKSSRGFLSSLAKGTHSRFLRSVLAASSLFGASALEPQKTSADNKVVASFAPAITYDNPAQLIKDGLRPPPHDYEFLDPNFPGKIMGNTKDGWWVTIAQDGTVTRLRDNTIIGYLDPRITQSLETVKKHLFELQPLPPLATAEVAKEFYAEQAKMSTDVPPIPTYDNPAQLIKDGLRPPPHDYELLDPNYPKAVMGNTKDGWWVTIAKDGTVTRLRDNVIIGMLDPRITQSVETVKKHLFELQPLPPLQAAAPLANAKPAAAAPEKVVYDDLDSLLSKLDARNPWGMWKDDKTPGGVQFVDNLDRWIMVTPDGVFRLQSTGQSLGSIDPKLVSSIPGRVTALRAPVEAQQAPPYDDYIQIRELIQPPEDFSWGQAQFPGHIMVQTKTKQKLWVKINQQTGVMTRVRDGLYMGRIDPRIVRSAQTTRNILFSDGKLPADGSDPMEYEKLDLGTQASGHAFDEDLKMGIWNMFPRIKINTAAANRSASTMRSAEEALRKAPELIGLMSKAAYYEAYKEKTGGGPASVDAVLRAASTYRYVAEVSEFIQGIPSAKEILDLMRKPDVFNTYYKLYSGKAAAESKQATSAAIQAMVQKAANKAATNTPSDSSLHLLELNKEKLIKAWDAQGLDGKTVFAYRMQGYNQEEAIAMSKGLQTAQNGAPKITNDFSGTLVAGPISPDTKMAINESNKQIAEQELDKTPQPPDKIYNLGVITNESPETLLAELKAKGNVVAHFELKNPSMVNLWQESDKIESPGSTFTPNFSMRLEGRALQNPYTSHHSAGAAESISSPLPAGKYVLTISDVSIYYLNSAKNRTYTFPIGINIKPYHTGKIEGRISIEGRPISMPISMGVVAFDPTDEQIDKDPDTQLPLSLDPTKPVIVIFHGMNSSDQTEGVVQITRAVYNHKKIDNYKNIQIVTVNWSEAARDGIKTQDARWTPAVGQWLARRLIGAGFSPALISTIGWSHGGNCSYFMAEEISGISKGEQINSTVAVDPAGNVPLVSGFDHTVINFKKYSRSSIAIEGSWITGSNALASTADTSFRINPLNTSANEFSKNHVIPIMVLVDILEHERITGSPFSDYISLENILDSTKRKKDFTADAYGNAYEFTIDVLNLPKEDGYPYGVPTKLRYLTSDGEKIIPFSE